MNTYLLGFVLVLLYLIIKDGRLDYDIITFFIYIIISISSWLGVVYFLGKYIINNKDKIKKFCIDYYLKFFKK